MNALLQTIERHFDESALPALVDYIRIPAKSPAFDADWAAHGHIEQAVQLAASWCRSQDLAGAAVEIMRLPGRTPMLIVDIPGQGGGHQTVLMYGHLDKQPEASGWRDGLGPWTPVIENNRLYGRGGADDGYAVFSAVSAVRALQSHGLPHARCIVLIECSEESGSPDLSAYVEALTDRIGTPSLIIALDSGCGDYERLWLTTSLRGLVNGVLSVDILDEGVHSGDGGGIVPSSFRIARMLLARIENATTGKILLEGAHAGIPGLRRRQSRAAADILGSSVYERFPWIAGGQPLVDDPAELLLNRAWRPTLAVTGAGHLPPPEQAGNVLRPRTTLKLSLRLPPLVNAVDAGQALKFLLESDPPYGSRVRFDVDQAATGWHAAMPPHWMDRAMNDASTRHFGKPAAYLGEGATIPFLNTLGQKFPLAQFVVTGVLGPHANAHGPNEFLHLPTAKRITACVAEILTAHS